MNIVEVNTATAAAFVRAGLPCLVYRTTEPIGLYLPDGMSDAPGVVVSAHSLDVDAHLEADRLSREYRAPGAYAVHDLTPAIVIEGKVLGERMS